jgi:hypothetical protein
MSTPDELTEAFLEMYFARALADLFASVFGAKFLRLWKPSPSSEAYVGFDQGWVRQTANSAKFEKSLRNAINNSVSNVPNFYFGYFMQFKCVRVKKRNSIYKAKTIKTPYFRVEIDMKQNPNTNRSQHETLLQLSTIRGADVSYACGMVFDAEDIYDEPDLDKLKIVPVDLNVQNISKIWAPQTRHSIQFQDVNANPLWCSRPVIGQVLDAKDWVGKQTKRTALDILDLVAEAREKLALRQDKKIPFLTVLEFKHPPASHAPPR